MLFEDGVASMGQTSSRGPKTRAPPSGVKAFYQVDIMLWINGDEISVKVYQDTKNRMNHLFFYPILRPKARV